MPNKLSMLDPTVLVLGKFLFLKLWSLMTHDFLEKSILLSFCHLQKNFSFLHLHTCLQLGSYQVCHLLIFLYLLIPLPFTPPLVFLCLQPCIIRLFHLSPSSLLPFTSPSFIPWIYLLLLGLLHLNLHLPSPMHVLSSQGL